MNRRRAFGSVLLFLVFALLLAACGSAPAAPPPAADAPAPAPAADAPATTGATLPNGVVLPADAAPPEYQVYVNYFDNTADFTTVDFMESVYKRGGTGLVDLLSDPLVRLNKDFEVQPAAALSWSSNEDGTVWTFNLDPNLIWSDDTPVTAEDYVITFQYAADPAHAWDFAWFFSAPGAILNWDAAVAGDVPVTEIGVKSDGPHTLIITTESPAPFLPAKMLYSTPFQQKAFETHGPLYNNDPATSVSSGPYILTEFKKGERLVYEANPKYRGSNKPYIQKLISIGARPETFFLGYEAGEVDYVPGAYLQTADNEIIAADPDLQSQVKVNAQDFRTDYLFFDNQNPPFDDMRVRQAFGHIVDRDTLIQSIITPSQGIPAYSFLMPGFPDANSEGLKDIQSFNPERARELLAEAGYPNGEGFPKLTLWLRNESTTRQALAQAIAATIKQELGIDVEVSNKDFKTFMDALNAKPTQVQFGMVSYGIDFLDPSNMLGVWLGSGRHNWANATYDAMVNDASGELDPAKRTTMFQDAERLLVEEAPAVYIYHRLASDLIKPYVKGDVLEPNKAGMAGLQWPGFSAFSDSISSLYITNEVLQYRSEPPR
jgi:peptide/nickel transport system substrate-binding protein/oligopeptide transport system substrate-binding protein